MTPLMFQTLLEQIGSEARGISLLRLSYFQCLYGITFFFWCNVFTVTEMRILAGMISALYSLTSREGVVITISDTAVYLEDRVHWWSGSTIYIRYTSISTQLVCMVIIIGYEPTLLRRGPGFNSPQGWILDLYPTWCCISQLLEPAPG